MSRIKFQIQLSVEGHWPDEDRQSLIAHVESMFRERAERLDGISIVASHDKEPYEMSTHEKLHGFPSPNDPRALSSLRPAEGTGRGKAWEL